MFSGASGCIPGHRRSSLQPQAIAVTTVDHRTDDANEEIPDTREAIYTRGMRASDVCIHSRRVFPEGRFTRVQIVNEKDKEGRSGSERSCMLPPVYHRCQHLFFFVAIFLDFTFLCKFTEL